MAPTLYDYHGGGYSDYDGDSSYVVTVENANAPAGYLAVITGVGYTAGLSSLVDSNSNSWIVKENYSNSQGMYTYLAYSVIGTQLDIGDTITLTFSGGGDQRNLEVYSFNLDGYTLGTVLSAHAQDNLFPGSGTGSGCQSGTVNPSPSSLNFGLNGRMANNSQPTASSWGEIYSHYWDVNTSRGVAAEWGFDTNGGSVESAIVLPEDTYWNSTIVAFQLTGGTPWDPGSDAPQKLRIMQSGRRW